MRIKNILAIKMVSVFVSLSVSTFSHAAAVSSAVVDPAVAKAAETLAKTQVGRDLLEALGIKGLRNLDPTNATVNGAFQQEMLKGLDANQAAAIRELGGLSPAQLGGSTGAKVVQHYRPAKAAGFGDANKIGEQGKLPAALRKGQTTPAAEARVCTAEPPSNIAFLVESIRCNKLGPEDVAALERLAARVKTRADNMLPEGATPKNSYKALVLELKEMHGVTREKAHEMAQALKKCVQFTKGVETEVDKQFAAVEN